MAVYCGNQDENTDNYSKIRPKKNRLMLPEKGIRSILYWQEHI